MKRLDEMTAADVVAADLAALNRDLTAELSAMAGDRLLVTGGAGFLGHYLVQTVTHYNATADRPIGVTVFDSFARGEPAWLRALADRGAVDLVRHDLRRPLPPETPEAEWIIHAASIASPTVYRRDPIGTMDANVNGLRSLLDWAVRRQGGPTPVKGLLFYSSSEIYGDPDPANIPTAEDYRGLVSCTGPRACYDEAKRYGETLCANFARQHGVPVKVARPFNNYGPGLSLDDGRVIPDFCRDVLAGRDIVMLSDGRATRTFCYAADAVAGYYKVLVNGGVGEAYNVGTETPEVSMVDLAERIAAIGREHFGYAGRVVTRQSADADYLVDNPNRRCPVIDKARQQVGYAPAVSLDEGLRRTMAWYAGARSDAANGQDGITAATESKTAPGGSGTMKSVKVCIVGSGYVGLVSGACFASHGHDVACVDLDADRVSAINAGRSGLHEPGLDELVRRQVDAGCLRATDVLASAVRASDLTLLCVPTPFDADAGRINLAFVRRAAGQVGAALRGLTRPHAVVVKSTCVPGTADGVVGPIVCEASGRPDIGIGANPEFLSEGSAVEDFLNPDRIVIGGDELALRLLARLHGGFDESRIVRVSAATAEAIKYASNAMLATAVSFANEVGDVCEATPGVDVAEVLAAVHRSRYLTVECGEGGTKQAGLARFLEAGCGYGGSCLPKDTRALAGYAASRGVATPLLDAVTAVNESRPMRVLAAIRRAGLSPDGLTVAVLGTAFKSGTADVRQSPATAIVDALLSAGAHVTTFDPAANENTRRLLGSRVDVADSLVGAVAEARAVVVAVAWPEFDGLADLLRGRERQPLVVDGRRRLDPHDFERYAGVGRSPQRTTDP